MVALREVTKTSERRPFPWALIDAHERIIQQHTRLEGVTPCQLSIHGPYFLAPPRLFPLGSRSALLPTLTSTSTDEAVCPDVLNACLVEPDCFACASWSILAGPQKMHGCMGKYLDLGSDICTTWSYGICCADEFVTTVDCAGNAAFVEAELCRSSYYSSLTGGAECTSFSCLPATTTSEQGDDDGVVVTADDGITDDDWGSVCVTEGVECLSDEECAECRRASVDAKLCEPEAWEECANEYVPGYTGGCESITPTICCPDQINGSGNSCSENKLWTSLEVCVWSLEMSVFAGEECDETWSFTTCDSSGGSGGVVGTDDDAAETSEEELDVGDDGDDATGGDDSADNGAEIIEEPEEDGEDTDPEGGQSRASGAGSTLSITVATLALGWAVLAVSFAV